MENPWIKIRFDTYVKHMSESTVYQYQTLNKIFKEQYTSYNPKSLLVLGITDGNGLEHIGKDTENVYGIDVNSEYLELCQKKYQDSVNNLCLKEIDMNEDFLREIKVDLIIANLFLEYIKSDKFFKQVELVSYKNKKTMISVVIQKNNGNNFVSNSKMVEDLAILENFHRNIGLEKFKECLQEHDFTVVLEKSYVLPNEKEFIRLDFCKSML